MVAQVIHAVIAREKQLATRNLLCKHKSQGKHAR